MTRGEEIRRHFPVPVPPPVAAVIGIVATVFVVAGTQWMPRNGSIGLAAVIPLHIALGLAIYYVVLFAMDQRPRNWCDRDRFADYVARWRSQGGAPFDPATTEEELRAVAWFDGSIAIAQQSGFVAGAAAAFDVAMVSYTLAVIVFAVTACAVGLSVRQRLLAVQSDVLQPVLNALESEDDGR